MEIYLTSDGQSVSITTDKSASQEDIMTHGGIVVTPPPATKKPETVQNTAPSAGTNLSAGTDYNGER